MSTVTGERSIVLEHRPASIRTLRTAEQAMTVKQRKGIILAGGSGTRLYPLTRGISKQLMAVYDKPMIYYPLSTLMLADIREILIITSPQDLDSFQRLLGDGSELGLSLSYATQERPNGIAEAFLIGAAFLAGHPSALILGDNIFYGHGFPELLASASNRDIGASVLAYRVKEPQSYGVVEFDETGRAFSIDEKPEVPRSSFAVTGLYFHDASAVDRAGVLSPSFRGELEITDLNRSYLEEGALHVDVMGRGMAWLDTGTHASLLDAASYVRIIEERQGLKICCPEEIAWRRGFIGDAQLEALAEPLLHSGYGEYLLAVLHGGRGA